jgi:hypothetical protein
VELDGCALMPGGGELGEEERSGVSEDALLKDRYGEPERGE